MMTWLLYFLAGVSGLALGWLVANKRASAKYQQREREATSVLARENSQLSKVNRQLQQEIADTRYQLAESQKDFRSVREQLERLKAKTT